jgi:hypothetical protein
MERFLTFITSPKGRWARIVGGSLLLSLVVQRRVPRPLVVPGTVALLSGVLDFVPFTPLLGLPARGPALRAQLGLASEAPLIASYSDRKSAKRARQGAPLA